MTNQSSSLEEFQAQLPNTMPDGAPMGEFDQQFQAEMAFSVIVGAAAVTRAFCGPGGDFRFDTAVQHAADAVDRVVAPDLVGVEAVLAAQSVALAAIFSDVAIKAGKATDSGSLGALLPLALKAQDQCRETLAALATVRKMGRDQAATLPPEEGEAS